MGAFHSRPLPKLVIVRLSFLKALLERLGRNAAVGEQCQLERELFRTDARAEGDEVWIGGLALDNGKLSECPGSQNASRTRWAKVAVSGGPLSQRRTTGRAKHSTRMLGSN